MFKITLKIDGMMCGMCESHINDTIRKSFAVKKVSSSHGKGKTEFITDTAIDEEQLRKAIAETGYTLVDIQTEPYEKKGFSLFGKKGNE
ncbi:MAG: cation transporter [Lachnospiraceae bacterium]|nr:cation transporter [Lachnospiraceae bacterium]